MEVFEPGAHARDKGVTSHDLHLSCDFPMTRKPLKVLRGIQPSVLLGKITLNGCRGQTGVGLWDSKLLTDNTARQMALVALGV